MIFVGVYAHVCASVQTYLKSHPLVLALASLIRTSLTITPPPSLTRHARRLEGEWRRRKTCSYPLWCSAITRTTPKGPSAKPQTLNEP